MAKYKVGDKVVIVDDLLAVSEDSELGVDVDMYKYQGETAVITEVCNNSYEIDLDNGDWFWEDIFFKDEESNSIKPKYEVGDCVRIKDRASLESNKDKYPHIVKEMYGYADKLAKITRITKSANYEYDKEWLYNIDLDNSNWNWIEDWFEAVENKNNNENKPKYEVGDYVRIRSDLKENNYDGITSTMVSYAGTLAKITYVAKGNLPYKIDADKGTYWWSEDCFEYRLGNYEDNPKSKTTYTVGYKYHGMTHEFVGFLDKWCVGRCEFHREDGTILVVNYEDISYVIPKDGVE